MPCPEEQDALNLDHVASGAPFEPVAQLLAVMPPPSAPCLPVACHSLMTSPTSPLKDNYPASVPLDPNHQRHRWQWVALLPFIEERGLRDALDTVRDQFTPEEAHRNTTTTPCLFPAPKGTADQFPFLAKATTGPQFTLTDMPHRHRCHPVSSREGNSKARKTGKRKHSSVVVHDEEHAGGEGDQVQDEVWLPGMGVGTTPDGERRKRPRMSIGDLMRDDYAKGKGKGKGSKGAHRCLAYGDGCLG